MRQQASRYGTVTVVLAYIVFMLVKLAIHDFDISRPIVAGSRYFDEKALIHPIHVEKNSDGYDGQFFYRFALDPLAPRRAMPGITMEKSAVVRYQRILYPVVAWLMSGGTARLVPLTLILVNIASIVVLARVAVAIAGHYGLPAGVASLIPLYPGFVLSLGRDTAEILATTLALSAVFAALKHRYWIAAALGCAAVLSRETTLFYLAGFGVMSLFAPRDRGKSVVVLLYATPLILYLGWQVLLHRLWGTIPVQSIGPHDFSAVPLVEYCRWAVRSGYDAFSLPIRYSYVYGLVMLLGIPAYIVFVVTGIVASKSRAPEIVAPWALFVGMAMFFTGAIWIEPYGYLRVLCDLYVLGIVALMAAGNADRLRRLQPIVAVAWFATAVFAL